MKVSAQNSRDYIHAISHLKHTLKEGLSCILTTCINYQADLIIFPYSLLVNQCNSVTSHPM